MILTFHINVCRILSVECLGSVHFLSFVSTWKLNNFLKTKTSYLNWRAVLFHSILCHSFDLSPFLYARNCDKIYIHLCICEFGPNYFAPKIGTGCYSETSEFLYEPSRFAYPENYRLINSYCKWKKFYYFTCIIYCIIRAYIFFKLCAYVCMYIYICVCVYVAKVIWYSGLAQSVWRLSTCWSNPGGGEIFRTRPDRPWGLSRLLYNGYRVFPGSKAAGAWCWSPTPSSAEVTNE
jgi:hypothetical protein